MDPLTLASAFATVVGLIVSFRQEQGARETLTTDEFLHWLTEHKHVLIRAQIEGNHALLAGITRLLASNRDEVLERITGINEQLALLLSRVQGFDGVSRSIFPTIELSEQAYEILQGLVESGGSQLMLIQTLGGTFLEIDGVGGFGDLELRFLEDDLATLCRFDFLTPRAVDRTEKWFRLTRQGQRYIESLAPAKTVDQDSAVE
jgi:hypothetical protein